jgi:hypothetical protein
VIVVEWISVDGSSSRPGPTTTRPAASSTAAGTRPYFDDLVDGYRLMINPLVLGGGKGIFRDDGVLRALRLVEGQVTSTGAILSTYARA